MNTAKQFLDEKEPKMSQPDLLPCPFCGSDAAICHSKDVNKTDTYCACCTKCSCSLGEDRKTFAGDWLDSHDFLDQQEAENAWNKRHH